MFPTIYVDHQSLLAAVTTFGTGSFLDLSPSGTTLYATDAATEKLFIYDVTTPSAPALVTSVATGSSTKPMGIRVSGTFAFVCQRHATNQGLAVWSVSSATTPVKVTTLPLTVPVRLALEPSSTYAYVVNGTEPGGGGNGTNMYVVDITTPSAPTVTGTYTGTAGYYPSGVLRSPGSNHVFVPTVNAYTGLQVVSVATPSIPTLAGSCTTGPNFSPMSVASDETGNWVYMACADNVATNHFAVVNTATPTAPNVSNYQTLTTGGGNYLGHGVRYGSFLYQIRAGNVYTFSVSGSAGNPTLLQTVSSNVLNDAVVATSQSHLYACDATSVLHVLRIT